MCCLLGILAILGPRAAILVWWIADQARWNLAFENFLVPLLGFIFLPWVTLAYVLVYPGGVEGFDWIWLGLALLIDVGSWFGGGWKNRGRMSGAQV
ncbi:MAG: hypothetical protein ABWY52_02285 [Candidatus Limnocylindrales bacterium]